MKLLNPVLLTIALLLVIESSSSEGKSVTDLPQEDSFKSTWVSFFPQNTLPGSHFLLYKVGTKILKAMAFFRDTALFTVDYRHGFNLHFETTKEALDSILPSHLKPIPILVLKGQDEAKYLVSSYLAETSLDEVAPDTKVGRADMFTYVVDTEGKKALYFFSAFQESPSFTGAVANVYRALSTYFHLDPVDYSIAYPSVTAESITVGENSFSVVTSSSGARVSLKDGKPSSYNGTFHADFVAANSQVYRGKHGTRNNLFFNQDFFTVPVTSYDPLDVEVTNGELLHPLCTKLVGVEAYGDDAHPIRWYMEVA